MNAPWYIHVEADKKTATFLLREPGDYSITTGGVLSFTYVRENDELRTLYISPSNWVVFWVDHAKEAIA